MKNAIASQKPALTSAVLILMMLSMQGCTTPVIYHLSEVPASKAHIKGDLRYITVNPSGNIDNFLGPSMIAMYWQQSLQDAVRRSGLFDGADHPRYDLDVQILEMVKKSGVPTVTVAKAQYSIIDKETGRKLKVLLIDSVGTVPFSESFDGNWRIAESVSRALKLNIAQFLLKMEGEIIF